MTGFDCSGLVRLLLHSQGVSTDTPGTAATLARQFSPLVSEPKIGSLVFYSDTSGNVDHVAMCLDENHHIEAAGGDHRCIDLQTAIEMNAFVRVTPIREQNRVAILMPQYPHWPTP